MKVGGSITMRRFRAPGRWYWWKRNGFSGSLVVAEFDSLEDARAWADADPYVSAGVYGQVVVKPFKKVLP